jgi:hypothetical protein
MADLGRGCVALGRRHGVAATVVAAASSGALRNCVDPLYTGVLVMVAPLQLPFQEEL